MPRSLTVALGVLLPFTLLLAVFAVYHATLWAAHRGQLGFLPYAYSELLINYSAGAIRRGLLGQILADQSHGGSALVATGRLLFANYVFFTVCFVALAFRKLRSSWLILLVCLIPSGVVARAFMGEFWSRKESFFFSMLAVSALLLVAIRHIRDPGTRRFVVALFAALVFLESVIASAIHDGFTFMTAPAFAYILQSAWRLRGPDGERTAKRITYWYLATQVFLFLVLGTVFHTNTRIAERIWESLSPYDQAFFPGADKGGITTLTLGMRAVVGNLPRLLNQGILWWYAAPICLLFFYCAAVVTLSPKSTQGERGWLRCYATLFLTGAPMFLIGYDYGRWIAAIQLSFLIVWLSTGSGELSQLHLLPQNFFVSMQQRAGQTGAALLSFLRSAAGMVRRHAGAAVLAMLLFDCFSYLPEVAPGTKWTSLAKQVPILARAGVEVLRHRE